MPPRRGGTMNTSESGQNWELGSKSCKLIEVSPQIVKVKTTASKCGKINGAAYGRLHNKASKTDNCVR